MGRWDHTPIDEIGSSLANAGQNLAGWYASHNPGLNRPKPSGNFLAPVGSLVNGVRPRPNRPKPKPKPSAARPSRPGGSTRPSSGSGSNRVSGASTGTSGSGVSGNHRVVRRPATFTDGQGNVRRVRQTRTTRATAAPADPIAKLVDEIIAGMNAPLENDKKTLTEQSAGNINQTNRLHDFYDQQVGAIRDDATQDMGAILARAAELKGISADTVAKHQDYLRSMMGQSAGGTLDQQVGQAASETQGAIAATNDSLINQLQGEGQSLNDTMAQIQVSGRAAQRELNQQELLRRAAGIREIDRAKAENQGQRASMLHQMRAQAADQALKQQVAEAEWGLKNAQAASLDNYRQGQLALGAARLEMQADQRATKMPPPGRYGNIPKRYDSAIGKVWSDLNSRFNSEDGLPAPWRTAHQALVDQGLDPTAAAFLATRWFNDSITGSSPQNIRTMLANRGVSVAAQKRIINNAFGPRAWANMDRSLMDNVGAFIDDALPN
jgi:hypothetical protein